MVSHFLWVISMRARCENSLFSASTVLSSARTVIFGCENGCLYFYVCTLNLMVISWVLHVEFFDLSARV